jgi:hypothetical protein
MHHQTDTLSDSEYFQIFPTLVGLYNLQGYHPAEEPKVKKYIQHSIKSTRRFLDDMNLLLLKNHLNDCVKAYSNEYGTKYYEVDESWYVKLDVEQGLATKRYDSDRFIGYYIINCLPNSTDLILNPPFKSETHETDLERSVSIYTAPNEKFIIEGGRLILTPGHCERYFTDVQKSPVDMIMFNVK